jgi:hypothetical protein
MAADEEPAWPHARVYEVYTPEDKEGIPYFNVNNIEGRSAPFQSLLPRCGFVLVHQYTVDSQDIMYLIVGSQEGDGTGAVYRCEDGALVRLAQHKTLAKFSRELSQQFKREVVLEGGGYDSRRILLYVQGREPVPDRLIQAFDNKMKCQTDWAIQAHAQNLIRRRRPLQVAQLQQEAASSTPEVTTGDERVTDTTAITPPVKPKPPPPEPAHVCLVDCSNWVLDVVERVIDEYTAAVKDGRCLALTPPAASTTLNILDSTWVVEHALPDILNGYIQSMRSQLRPDAIIVMVKDGPPHKRWLDRGNKRRQQGNKKHDAQPPAASEQLQKIGASLYKELIGGGTVVDPDALANARLVPNPKAPKSSVYDRTAAVTDPPLGSPGPSGPAASAPAAATSATPALDEQRKDPAPPVAPIATKRHHDQINVDVHKLRDAVEKLAMKEMTCRLRYDAVEADELIAVLVDEALLRGLRVIIMSADGDFEQLQTADSMDVRILPPDGRQILDVPPCDGDARLRWVALQGKPCQNVGGALKSSADLQQACGMVVSPDQLHAFLKSKGEAVVAAVAMNLARLSINPLRPGAGMPDSLVRKLRLKAKDALDMYIPGGV